MDPVTQFKAEVKAHFYGGLKGPFNGPDRARAGLDEAWYQGLQGRRYGPGVDDDHDDHHHHRVSDEGQQIRQAEQGGLGPSKPGFGTGQSAELVDRMQAVQV